MLKTRHLAGLAMAVVLLVGQVSLVGAAPQLDPLVGTIDAISEGTDSGGNTVIIVDYTDTDGNAQTVQLSVSDAESLGLISVDLVTGDITILAAVGGAIDLTGIEPEADPCAPSGEGEVIEGAEEDTSTEDDGGGGGHPVAGALCDFFQGSLGVSYDTIFGWHEDGFGFGVIAQALFMAENLGVDPALILEAKKSGEYGDLGLPEDADVGNWGQLKKFVLADEVKSLTNLGAIMSGRAEPSETETPTEEPTEEPTISALSSSALTGNGATKGQGKSGEHGKSGERGKGKNK